MEALLAHLRNRENAFSVTIVQQDEIAYIKKCLLSAPSITASIKTMAYSYYKNFSNSIISFTVEYDPAGIDCPVFLVRNQLEMTTAISLMYRLHASKVKILVDNSAHFIASDNLNSTLQMLREDVDEELQTHQLSQYSFSSLNFFDNILLILTLSNDYFDSAKAINDMSCIAAATAISIRNECHGDAKRIIYRIHKWFYDNIKYKDNDLISDHSAVNLLKSKQGVCQAIAAFAYQILTYSGLDARDVHGDGNGASGWEAHAWNMVKIQNVWYHIDYTFALNTASPEFLVSKELFSRDHRWDETKYNDSISSKNVRTRQALDHSVIMVIPNMPCFSVNGCIIDTSNSHPVCIVHNGNVLVAVFDIVSVCGGCYELKGNSIHLYFDHNHYVIDTHNMVYLNNAWYIMAVVLGKLNYSISISGEKILLNNQN